MTYKQECEAWGQAIRDQADRFYDDRINATQALLEEAKQQGKDPLHVLLEGGIAYVNYVQVLQDLHKAKRQAYVEADARAAQCDREAVPDWLADPQKVTDYAMTAALLPFVALTNRYAAAKVDLGDVYKGYPFGGENALIPKARDDALNALGIGGDTAKVLRDPVNAVRDTVGNTAKEAAETVVEVAKKILPPIPGVKW